MKNNQNDVPVVEVIVTLESALAALTDTERLALLLDSKKLAAFKKSLPKAADLKMQIMTHLSAGPMSDDDLAKACGTTKKTIQSYMSYLKADWQSADIMHNADVAKGLENPRPKGIRIYTDGGQRMLKADYLKTLA